jgi:hypothetical protein
MKQSTLLLAVLLLLLGLAVIVAYVEWTSVDTEMPATGYIALWGGIIFSLLVGCGLMGLMFYSSRRGYDEKAQGGWLGGDDDRDDRTD